MRCLHPCRYIDPQTKIQALQLIAAVVRGLGDRDRNTVAIQGDALKAAARVAKEAPTAETCLAAAGDSPPLMALDAQNALMALGHVGQGAMKPVLGPSPETCLAAPGDPLPLMELQLQDFGLRVKSAGCTTGARPCRGVGEEPLSSGAGSQADKQLAPSMCLRGCSGRLYMQLQGGWAAVQCAPCVRCSTTRKSSVCCFQPERHLTPSMQLQGC